MAKIDRSGTITLGGTAQQLMPSFDPRVGFWIQNNSAGDLWVNDEGGTAAASQPSFIIKAGQLYERPPGEPCPYAISIFGATTGQTFTCEEW